MFAVAVDEPIKGGMLTLNGRSAALIHNVDGAYWGKWTGPDADGRIEIRYPDGAVVHCALGYVTPGMEAQRFSVTRRVCFTVRR